MNFRESIVLENDRVRLEPLSFQHFDELVLISNESPNLLKYSPSPFGTSELLEQYIDNAVQARKSEIRYPFAIYDKWRKRFIGSSSFGNVSMKDARVEIGWTWLDKHSQGTGLNPQCKLLLLSYAFENLEVKRVEFKTDSRNLQSRRAIEKIGGTFEGTLRSHTLMPDGFRRDSVYYSILSSEWKEIKLQLLKQLEKS